MRTYNILLPIAAGLALASLAACNTGKDNGADTYVTVRDGKFYQGDNEYRDVGTNFW